MSEILPILGYFCLAVGVIISLIYGIILMIQAFQESLLWGLCYLFIPFANLVFIIKFWDETKKPFLMSLLGLGLIVAAAFLVPDVFNGLDME